MYTYDTYLKSDNELELLSKESSGTEIVEIMTGANANTNGKEGLVPAPVSADKDKYLKGDGTWSNVEFSKKAEQDATGNTISDTYAKRSLYGDTVVSVGRKSGTTVGMNSTTFGFDNCANGKYSMAIGLNTQSMGISSLSVGNDTTAMANNSVAIGMGTNAGKLNSFSCGQYNREDYIRDNILIIGNGTSSNIKSNALSVTFDGKLKSASTITAETTADYAEFFEWEDGNPNAEDRVGKFVTLNGDKISIAKSNEDYILGIVSGAPFVLGNGDCDVWTGMWLRDDFNRVIYEPAPKIEFDEESNTMKEVFDEDGNLELKVDHKEDDFIFDEIGSVLKIKEMQQNRRELFESLELFFKVFYLGEGMEID